MANDLISTGNCGEYFVAAELERRGFTVALPMSNVKDFDILAIHRVTHKQLAIQVKTTHHSKKQWVLSAKNENLFGDDIFYIFVTLCGLETPQYHIVPSKFVAETITSEHRKWLNTPAKNGNAHKDNSIRKFDDSNNVYLNNWDILSSD
ncbi:MAG: hypothetical protein V3G42_00120 [Oscillospiraceae bacterium]